MSVILFRKEYPRYLARGACRDGGLKNDQNF